MKKASLLIALALVAVLALTACGESNNGGSTGGEKETTAAVETTAPDSGEASFPAPSSDIFATIALGDFDGISALCDQIQNFEADNKTVVIEGEIDKTGSSWVIHEANEAGTEYRGYAIQVEGWEDSDYPANGTVAEIVGVVVPDGLAHYIAILPENFVTK